MIKEERHRGIIKFHSKFIYDFVSEWLSFGKNKTLTVRLKNSLNFYSAEFLQGFILGLALTDGYLKNKFIFTTISENLANNVINILRESGFTPRLYVHKRKRYGWHDLFMISLKKAESKNLLDIFDDSLRKINYSQGFIFLKGYLK